MKLIALFLTFCISLNVSASTFKELDLLVDNYQYDLSVEWDQKDKKFYEDKTNQFFQELSVLMSTKGVTNKDILALVEKKVAKKADLEALKLKLALLGEVKTPEQLSKVLQEHAKSFYSKGANWNGEVVAAWAGGILIVSLIGFAIWYAASYECVEWEEKWVCNTVTRDDTYGTVISSDTTSSTTTYTETVCGYEDVCSKSEKKD